MSTSGLSAKSHGEKSTASGGKKYQAVNINSLYSGKSLVGQKSSAAPKNGGGGLQSLGKATAVARRMPPPANLPSLKSESAGQDIAVNIVPSGQAGWGTTQQQSTTPLDLQLDAKSFFDGNKKTPSDGISLRPAGAAANKGASGMTMTTGGSGNGGVGGPPPGAANASTQQQGQSSTASRPTWSTRIGTSSSGSYLAAQTAQDYPKLMNDSESGDVKATSTAPSLRPQRSGTWKSGGGHGAKQESESPPPSQNGRDRSRSPSPASSDHASPPSSRREPRAPLDQLPPYMQQPGYGQRQGPYPRPGVGPYPGPHSAYPPHHYPPTLYPPPPGGHRGASAGGPPFPPSQGPPQYDYRYGPPHQNAIRGPPPVMMQGPYGLVPPPPGPNRGKQGDGGDQGPSPMERFRGGPPPMPRNNEYNVGYGGMRNHPAMPDREYGPPPRDGRGDQWPAPPAAYYHSRERDIRYRENIVWSDDEGDDHSDRRYGRGEMRRNKTDKHAWSDGEDRFDEGEWTRYDEQREGGPPADGRQGQPNARSGNVYAPSPAAMKALYPTGPPTVGPPIMHGRDGRYGPPPMQQRYPPYGGYMPPHDQRHTGPLPLPMNYGQPPHQYPRTRGQHDIEAEEEEEIARQQQQQYARDAAIERSKQKRRLGQQTSVSGSSAQEQQRPSGDARYGAAGDTEDHEDSEADRSSSRESFGNRPGTRRPPTMPPRFARQGDARPIPPPGQQTFNYGRPYPHGPPPPNQYENSHFGQGDGAYYEKRSPRQTAQSDSFGTYDGNRRHGAHHRSDGKRHYGPDENEPPLGGRRDPYEDESREKQLKRPDSKDSLNSDKSSGKGEKYVASGGNSCGAGQKTWPKENSTVKEEDDYTTSKAADIDDDNEEDQKFETLSKPKVVVKRTMAASMPEKPKEQEKPATALKVESPSASEPKQIQKPVNQSAPAQKKDDVKLDSVPIQKSQSQPSNQKQQPSEKDDQSKKNVWEQRKEQLGSKQDSTSSSKEDGGFGEDTKPRDQGDYKDWSSSSSRGRGSTRGRGHREFVSSRRMHGHSVGGVGGGNRLGGSNWDNGATSFGGRRRGGSVGYGGNKSSQPTHDEEKADKKEKKESEGGSASTQGKWKEDGEQKEEKKEEQETDSQHSHDQQSATRGGKTVLGGRGQRGGKRGGGTSGYEDWNNRVYAGGAAVFSRSRGGHQGFGYHGYGDGEEEDWDYGYDQHRRYQQGRGGIGGAFRGAMPPRFKENERGGAGFGSSSGYRQHYQGGVGGASRGRHHATHVAKSPTGGGVNHSEGNDEWETASESSDIGERRRQDENKDAESSDRKKPHTSGPKSFSSQRRAPERRRVGGAYNASNTGDGRGGSHHRRAHHGVHDPADGKTTEGGAAGNSGCVSSPADQNSFAGSKNAIVASHHSSSNRADPRTMSEYPGRNGNRKFPKKDEKPASKSGALATVDINNIAGVVIIDDQPDLTSENNDGFQEVVSKKRLKKDVQQSDEKDRKSQSPIAHGRLQPHSGSVGSKNERAKKPMGSSGGYPASVSASASTRSSAGDSAGAMMTGNMHWDNKTAPSSGLTSNNPNAFANNRQMHSGVDHHQNYRSNVGPVASVSTIGLMNTELVVGGQPRGNMPSKTGVEIWGTPDPIPFAGASEQSAANKCVARPAKTTLAETAARPKSVEFIAESLNKATGDGGVKLDFTFDASLAPTRDSKQNVDGSIHRRDTELENNGDNSPSADQLSEKIASVKKVWDKVQAAADMEDVMANQQAGGGSFFGTATDAETAAIVSSAASLAVLQSVSVDQNETHHPSGYDGESSTGKTEPSGGSQPAAATGSSSKTEGPNVAKVRPQQILTEQQPIAPISHMAAAGQDEFANAVMSMGYAGNGAAAMFPFAGGNNASLFSAQFTTKGDFGSAQSPLSNYAQFPAAASNRSIFGQPPTAFVLPPAVSQSMEIPFGSQLRSNPIGDQNLLFGAAPPAFVSQQPIRGHSANQQASLAKPASTVNIYGNVQGSFLVHDAGVSSLFSHPPPSSFQQPPALTRGTAAATSPGGVDFSRPPPSAIAAGAVLQAHVLQAPTAAKMATYPGMTNQAPSAFGWSANVVAPPPHQQKTPAVQGGRKGFNPTIGPPNAQKVNATPAASASGILGLMQPMGHVFGAQQALMAQQQPLSISTNLVGGQQSFRGRGSKGQGPNVDQAKRDGDLLQQMDKFINSTGDEESGGPGEEAETAAVFQ